VVRTPHAPDTVVDTLHWLRDPLLLLTTRISEELCLLQYLLLLQTPHADGFLSAIDVVPYYNRVLSWAWGDGHFDLGICGSEFREVVAEERTRRWRLDA
jgi:hypothetical protein